MLQPLSVYRLLAFFEISPVLVSQKYAIRNFEIFILVHSSAAAQPILIYCDNTILELIAFIFMTNKVYLCCLYPFRYLIACQVVRYPSSRYPSHFQMSRQNRMSRSMADAYSSHVYLLACLRPKVPSFFHIVDISYLNRPVAEWLV